MASLSNKCVRLNPVRCDCGPESQYQIKEVTGKERPVNDPTKVVGAGFTKPLCGANPYYESPFVLDNDFPALLEDVPEPKEPNIPQLKSNTARGACRVICFSQKSNLSLPLMFQTVMKDMRMKEHMNKYKSNLLMDYAKQDEEKNERLVVVNDDWLGLVPYCDSWRQHETMIIPRKRHILRMTNLTEDERLSLADIMKQLTYRYDNLFGCSFPYSIGFYNAPSGPGDENQDYSYWQFHAIYYPPLLRSVTARKHVEVYEKLRNFSWCAL
jgi:UDPglucose--hexose-1-phosphate uridylyltransferase